MKISVVVRSHNDRTWIDRTMTMLKSQRLEPGWELELINIDNESSDGTWERIQAANPGGILLTWPQARYVPGAVLNHAVAAAHGDWVVFNNSDAVPLTRDYLQKLLAPLCAGTATAVFAAQEPRPDARPLVRFDHGRAFGDGATAARWRHFFSLAAAAAPRSLLLAEPFDETLQYSEDIEWSWRIKQHGGTIQYVPEARVEHSHNYSLPELRRRFYNEGAADARIFGGDSGAWRNWLRPLVMAWLRDLRYLVGQGQWRLLPGELRRRAVQLRSFYRGRRAGAGLGELR